eukprot:GFYU01006280.1.p1 GENE.GFYU01006280.1~~GFYU01006280.1.p1  ORF type:complete len:190 (+),score=14.13 GFYU01006280.1:29-598(+)
MNFFPRLASRALRVCRFPVSGSGVQVNTWQTASHTIPTSLTSTRSVVGGSHGYATLSRPVTGSLQQSVSRIGTLQQLCRGALCQAVITTNTSRPMSTICRAPSSALSIHHPTTQAKSTAKTHTRGYKLKTKKAAAKRFRVTGSGKIKRYGAFRRHLASNKTYKQTRQGRGVFYVEGQEAKNVLKLLPNI